MTCPNCRAANPANNLFCFNCQASLIAQNTTMPGSTTNNQPAWLNSATPSKPESSSLSIEDLLKATETNFLGSNPHNPAPAPASIAPGYATVPPSPYAPQPLPGNYAGIAPVSGGAVYAPLPRGEYRPGEYASPPLFQPGATGEEQAENWVEDGIVHFTDEYGYTSTHVLAGFIQRFIGAIIDGIITSILIFIVYIIGGMAFGMGAVREFNTVGRTAAINNATMPMLLFLVIAGTTLPFFYHMILVGISGQTMGHRIMGIEVVSKKGPGVSFGRALLRSGYGVIATAANIVTNRNIAPFYLNLILVVLALGMLWALLDKNRQGLHDKLAGTYVVRVQSYE